MRKRQRRTRQWDAIWNAIEQAGRPLSPDELRAEAGKEVPSLGMATVYRTVNAMMEEELLASVDIPGEPPRYERADLPHHHHFRCDVCRRVYDLDGCAVRQPVRLPDGFQARGHELTVYGLCATCRAGPRRRPGRA